MGKVVVPRAVDRSLYPHSMMFVDAKGNICVADRPSKLSEEEKAKRQAARDEKRNAFRAEKASLRDAMKTAKTKAKKSLSAEDAEEYANAKAEYDNFRKG